MKKNILFSCFFLCIIAIASSQNSPLPNDNNVRRAWALQLGFADGFGSYRDMGTAPITFNGLMLQQNLALHLIFPERMQFSLVSRSAAGIFEDAVEPSLNFGAYDISNCSSLRFLKPLNNSRFYLGFALTNFFDLTINPEYENASTGISDFMGPEAIARAELKTRRQSPLLFHGEIALMPIAILLRPGYSYIDNYTSTHPVTDAILSDFDLAIKPFAAISTDFGIDIITGPASRISFSYLWCYHTTGNSGFHRFDRATHLLSIDFLIKLRTKTNN